MRLYGHDPAGERSVSLLAPGHSVRLSVESDERHAAERQVSQGSSGNFEVPSRLHLGHWCTGTHNAPVLLSVLARVPELHHILL